MAEESFDDVEVAAILNADYVSVKIDREQWPLVDEKFKLALEQLKGEAGWPINVILTPEGKIVWIESYINKNKFSKVIQGLAKRWRNKPAAIESLAERIDNKLNTSLEINETTLGEKPFKSQLSKKEWRNLLPKLHKGVYEALIVEQESHGPRFFRANWMLGLLDEYLRTGDRQLLDIVESQIETILLSPVYDMAEGGFHRYSVDGKWQVPHFEKMLYTQANMIRVLAKAYAVTGKSHYLIALEQTSDWVESWLRNDVGYSSAVSALSEGDEGKYYFIKNDAVIQRAAGKLAFIQNLSNDWRGTKQHQKLHDYRKTNVKPLVDEKVIVSWNSLYAISLLDAYQVTREPKYLTRATELLDSLWLAAKSDNTLFRTLFHGRASIPAQIEDYAWFGLAWLKLSFYQPWQTIDIEFEHIGTSTSTSRSNIANNSSLETLDSALERSNWLLGKLGKQLDPDVLNRFDNDGELPSTYTAIFGALSTGVKINNSRQYKVWLKELSRHLDTTLESLISQYSFVEQKSDELSPVYLNQARFAKGHGKVTLEKVIGKTRLQFDLEPGWHVNANPASNERYIATQVSVESDSLNVKVQYPQAIHKRLGFNDESLALYEGKFAIELTGLKDKEWAGKINIRIQACSDSLCLLPENILLFLSGK